MDFIYLIKGFIIGFVLPIPLGPAGILCIRRTIAQGKLHGFLTGLSAALTDTMFSIVAAFGITLVSNFIYQHQHEIRVIGGIILFALGYRTLRPRPIRETEIPHGTAPVLSFFSTFLVTLTNPMTVFAFAAIFVTIGVADLIHNHTSAGLLVAGVFAGSLSWFSLLTVLSSTFKVNIASNSLPLLNKITGSLLVLFGFIALMSGLGIF
jgi:threonine/homoserine/homoserine lactone efflux protein